MLILVYRNSSQSWPRLCKIHRWRRNLAAFGSKGYGRKKSKPGSHAWAFSVIKKCSYLRVACFCRWLNKLAAHSVGVERVKTGFLTGSVNPHCRNLNLAALLFFRFSRGLPSPSFGHIFLRPNKNGGYYNALQTEPSLTKMNYRGSNRRKNIWPSIGILGPSPHLHPESKMSGFESFLTIMIQKKLVISPSHKQKST